MRGLKLSYLIFATLVLVHAAPHWSTTRGLQAYRDARLTIRHPPQRNYFANFIGWCKNSFGRVADLLINWSPQRILISEMGHNMEWHESGFYIPEDSPRGDGTSNLCTNPIVRKEWRSLSTEQRKAWISAVHCLARLPGSGKLSPSVMPTDPKDANPPLNQNASWYDDISYVHIDMNSVIHQTGFFYPWHRYYLWSFENILKDQCGYTGTLPYWDWTQDTDDFENSTMFNPSISVSGIGGFGQPEDDYAVHDGAFADLQLAYPIPHTLRRQYTPYPFRNQSTNFFPDPDQAAVSVMTREEVQKITSGFRGDFKAFQTYSERLQGPHMSVHLMMGGELGGSCPRDAPSWCVQDAKWSPNDPLFWMHHGMLDKLWYDWQKTHPENFWSFEAGTIRDLETWPQYPVGTPPAMTPRHLLPAEGILLGNFTVQDMFNTTSNAPLCYIYA